MADTGGLQQDPSKENPAVMLARLRVEAQQMKAAKKVLTKNLRNARRVNSRLKAKARKLSDCELLQIVAMRNNTSVAILPGSNSTGTCAEPSASSQDAIAARESVTATANGDADEMETDVGVASGNAGSQSKGTQDLDDREDM